MSTSIVLTCFAPALMLVLIAVITRFSPPSLGKSFVIKSPDWWSRDQETWDKANQFLAQKYFLYGGILTVFCGVILYLNYIEMFAVGYVLLLLFFVLANFQARKYMGVK